MIFKIEETVVITGQDVKSAVISAFKAVTTEKCHALIEEPTSIQDGGWSCNYNRYTRGTWWLLKLWKQSLR